MRFGIINEPKLANRITRTIQNQFKNILIKIEFCDHGHIVGSINYIYFFCLSININELQ
jgi:hypothetical protein